MLKFPALKSLPPGKKAAVVFSLDDCHPASSSDGYEAGGDLERGALGRLEQLLSRHEELKCTLFTTADWREITPFPTRKWLAALPFIAPFFYLAKRWPKGKMRLDTHPEFVKYLSRLPRTEIACHGLEHYAKGKNPVREFEQLNARACCGRLIKADKIFKRAGLEKPIGIAPPGWGTSRTLEEVLPTLGYRYIAASRDLESPVHPDALCQGSGLRGVPMLFPCVLNERGLIHIPCNWSATSTVQRAEEIIESGGVLSIKAHMIKKMPGYESVDGLEGAFVQRLDSLFSHLREKYKTHLWWATMKEMTEWHYSQLKQEGNPR